MFKPAKTHQITKNFYVLRTLFVNFYILDLEDKLIVFDTGVNQLLSRIAFKKLKLDYNRVSHVFLTHSDFDHVSGMKVFSNAKVFLSKKEEPLINRTKARRGILFNKKIKNYNLIDDLETIKINNSTIKLISSPGHTIGSALYLINNQILITGDTISLSNAGEIKKFSFLQNMNNKENKKVVETLKDQGVFNNVSIIATGHHGYLKNK